VDFSLKREGKSRFAKEPSSVKEPLVSVKMITYNHAPYIGQAIEGVVGQKTTFPFELVIGEDCSTDGTREIVFEYQKKFPDIIRVITSEKNVGGKQNSRRVTKACEGKYIAWCEGDDFWHNPYKLKKQVDYLETHPECGLVYSSFDVFHYKDKLKIEDFVRYKKREIPKTPNLCDVVEGKVPALTCTVMMRRDIYLRIIESDPFLHQSDHFRMGDTQLWAETAEKYPIHYIPESLATYNITEESATRSKDVRKRLRFSISHIELRLYLCEKYKLPAHVKNKLESHWFDSSLRLAFHTWNGDLAEQVRRKKKKFTWKEWILYLGAKNKAFYIAFSPIDYLRASFVNKYKNWL